MVSLNFSIQLLMNFPDDAPEYREALCRDDIQPAHFAALAEALKLRIAIFHPDRVVVYGNTPDSPSLLLSFQKNVYAPVMTLP